VLNERAKKRKNIYLQFKVYVTDAGEASLSSCRYGVVTQALLSDENDFSVSTGGSFEGPDVICKHVTPTCQTTLYDVS
jgi:hypothetical protein